MHCGAGRYKLRHSGGMVGVLRMPVEERGRYWQSKLYERYFWTVCTIPVDSPVFSAPNESMKVGVWAKGEALGWSEARP